ncbi:MAG: PD-(D/E)XK nuclease family protein [Clostridia bacterium]|nr:PD-(D/E)XK nuclease family protein [Clostridia bacterium]
MRILTARPHRLLAACITRIGERTEAGEACMFLVPSQYTLQAELEIMDRLALEGTFVIDVLSPGRLQSRVFERAGAPQRVIFDERGKRMVLSELIAQEKEQLTIYRSAAESGTQGFAAKISSMIADFKRSGKTAQEILLAAEQMEDGPAKSKLQDAGRIYSAYEQRMAEELADAEDVSREMLARMERSGVLKGKHLFVYGFDMITPTFAAELVHMAKLAASLTLAVETDENAAPDGRLFAPVNLSLDRLAAAARGAGVAIERERIVCEVQERDDLRAMEHALYGIGVKPYEKDPEHISLRAASTMRAEVHSTAAAIRRMCRDGMSTQDAAIVYPKGSGYAPLLMGILPMYGIPAYAAEKRLAAAHPLSRLVLSALACASGGMRTADVIECIQTGFMGLTQEEMDALCAYAEGVDLRSEAWKRPFTYMKDDDEQALAQLNAAREKAAEPLLRFMAALRRAKDADGTIAAVIALLDELNAYDKLDDMRAALMEAGLAPEAEDCTQVWNQLMDTLDQLHTLLGGRRATAELAGKLLQEGLCALELAALPPADGAVICGEIGNVRTAQTKVLFAIGMNDLGAGGDAMLLTPSEQEAAAAATGAYLGMSAAERTALSQLDELKALSGAAERLIVSYALADETGRALREGGAVQALRRLFPALKTEGGLARKEQEEMLAAPAPAIESLSVRLSDALAGRTELTKEDASAYAALAQTEEGGRALAGVIRRLGDMPERTLRAAQARSLYGRPVMSVSRLETFAQCPYKHFVRYGLAPQQAMKPGVDRAELGTLYHAAAEQFTRRITQLPQFPEVEDAVCDRIMDEAVAPLIEEWRRSPLGQSERGEAIARRIGRTVRRTGRNIVRQFAGSRFRPMENELVFGQKGAAPIILELADGSHVYLQGRIDRIDVLDGQNGAIRVVDYKSGYKKFDPTMVYWGIQLQLLIYLSAALAEMPGMDAAGFFYCRIADPTVKTESRIREEVEKQIAKRLELAGISLADVEILRAQGEHHAGMITKDGKISGRHTASVVDPEGMRAMVAFARGKAAALASGAYGGEIADSPAQFGQFDACALCDYAAICRFDPSVRSKRRLAAKSLKDLQKI